MIRFRSLLAAAALALVAGPTAAGPIAVTDALGREVTLEKPAQRAIVLFNYEEFLAIAGPDAFDRVVGMNRYSWEDVRQTTFARFAAAIPALKTIPDVGNPWNNSVSLEKALSLKPDLILLPGGTFKAMEPMVKQFAAAGVPTVVFDYNASTLDKHIASTRAIGKAMGAEARAEELIDDYTTRYNDILARIARSKAPSRRVYIEIGMRGPADYGDSYPTTLWGAMINMARADNIAVGRVPDGQQKPLAAEYVLSRDPEVIFLGGSTWANAPTSLAMGFGVGAAETRARVKPFLERPGWSSLSAVKSGEVYAVHHGLPRSLFDFAAFQYVAKALHPDTFADVDPMRSLDDFYKRFLPVTLEGTWMLKYAE